ncbi:MAG: serine/threonine-protein kinase [Deltaproteobacteria bacterium]|nr:serine/threonine-protein kinase [Deltaproteobacteria bacterium]
MVSGFSSIPAPPTLKAGMAFESGSAYRLTRRLGMGGMGEVWLADRRSAAGHTQRVAVKFLSAGTRSASLAAEALRISQLSHDNIVPFLDSGRDANGRFFVAMAYVEGVDLDGLRDMIGMSPDAVCASRAATRLPDTIVGFVIFMVLRALQHAHTFVFEDKVVGLVHRDVSPGNILIDEARGFVKLTDFGVAIAGGQQYGEVVGKVPYMAPEVLMGEPADGRADLYGLGVVSYELLTGFNPSIHLCMLGNVLGAISQVMVSLTRPLRLPHEVIAGVDERLSNIVGRMLFATPDVRYSSAEEALADVRGYLFDRGVGPTTGSLAAYMRLMRCPDLVPTPFQRASLVFLEDGTGNLAVHPRRVLTPEAKRDFEAGKNPARRGA